MKYRTIVADPPWPLDWRGDGVGRRRRGDIGYVSMTLDAIKGLPVADLAEPDAHLYLWTTDEMALEGHALAVVRAWGFRRCGPPIVWQKPNFGMGHFPRPQHELALVCRRGALPFALSNVGSVQRWHSDQRHSAKPDGFQDLVEQASPGPYLELFARSQRLGWDTWGNEALCHVDLAVTS